MEIVQNVITHPFTWGLLLGLLVAAFIWKSSLSAGRNARREFGRVEKEMNELQGHLNTQLKINASGNEKLQQELDELRGQNENLRVNIAQLQQKPGRAELRQLQILESAASRMREQAPGFAPAWEQALRDAEEDAQSAESGLKKLVRKVIPAIGSSSPAPAKNEEPKA
jgi:DNA repair exonuclease SbcCD ATPase subunit